MFECQYLEKGIKTDCDKVYYENVSEINLGHNKFGQKLANISEPSRVRKN